MIGICEGVRLARRFLALVLLSGLMCGVAYAAPASTSASCTRQDEIQASQSVDAINTWPDAYVAYARYGKCDDGAIAEGFSDRIVHLFASHWSTLSEFKTLAARHAGFERFALRHIDSTADDEELEQMALNARAHCPSEERSLCKSLENAAMEATMEASHGEHG